jgi:predicted dehydrogenase
MNIDRRQFITRAAAAAGATLAGRARGAESSSAIRIGLIGAGWYGMVDARAALKAGGAEIAAVCDVDSEHLRQAADELEKLQGRRPREFKLHDEMLAMDGLHAAIVGTPPQWHALQAIAALERGLDLYLEKPVAYDIAECRAVAAAVRRTKRIVQVGFQRRQSPVFAQVRDFLGSGGAGTVVQADAQIHYRAGTLDPAPCDPPASLDWDLWCGPAPKIPYSPQVGHKNWRLEKTTGHGHLVDWGIHNIDAARLVLGVGPPRRVSAAGGIYRLKGIITTPDTMSAQFDFETVPLHWRHRLWGAVEHAPEFANGIFFYGDKATVFASDRQWMVFPAGKDAPVQTHKVDSDPGAAHMKDFLDAVRARREPSCPIEEGVFSTTAVKLAMIACDTGTTVEWDADAGRIANSAAAAALVRREYRAPWRHPAG